jgi:hypothetical protein
MAFSQAIYADEKLTSKEIHYVKKSIHKLLEDTGYSLVDDSVTFKRRKTVAEVLYRGTYHYVFGPIDNRGYTVNFKLSHGESLVPGKIEFSRKVAWSGESDSNNTTEILHPPRGHKVYLSLRLSRKSSDATRDVRFEDLFDYKN